jgi:hypothetical protein
MYICQRKYAKFEVFTAAFRKVIAFKDTELCRLVIVTEASKDLAASIFRTNAAFIDMEPYTEYWTLSGIVLFPTHYKQCYVKNNAQLKLLLNSIGLRMREN